MACAALGISAGFVASAVRGGSAPETPEPAALERALEAGEAVKVAEVPPAPGLRNRAVFVKETRDGLVCVWDAPGAGSHGPGGCNRVSDPFGGGKMMMSLAWDGGPALSTVTDARLIGIVAADVAAVDVRMSDGTSRRIPLQGSKRGAYRGFAYRIRPADLHAGVEPVAVVALDRTGRAIDRQTTGLR